MSRQTTLDYIRLVRIDQARLNNDDPCDPQGSFALLCLEVCIEIVSLGLGLGLGLTLD